MMALWFGSCHSADGMRAGNYGNLLVLIEQPRGEYAVTIAFLKLVTTLVKVRRPTDYPHSRFTCYRPG